LERLAIVDFPVHFGHKAEEEHLVSECQQRVDAVVERYLTVGPRPPETMFDHLYAELPKVYASQRDELKGVSHD
jgi:2-oxoisovalerate dehydrogenase E1 component alpha subunit